MVWVSVQPVLVRLVVPSYALQDLFVGFGGNVVRQAVRDGADWFVTSMTELSVAL
jgi:hypothetical protein